MSSSRPPTSIRATFFIPSGIPVLPAIVYAPTFVNCITSGIDSNANTVFARDCSTCSRSQSVSDLKFNIVMNTQSASRIAAAASGDCFCKSNSVKRVNFALGSNCSRTSRQSASL